jgi:ribosomal protein L29
MVDTKKKVNVLQDFRGMEPADLLTKIAELRAELVQQHQANKASELPSASVIAKTRKSIAKAMTVLTEKAHAKVQKEQEK